MGRRPKTYIPENTNIPTKISTNVPSSTPNSTSKPQNTTPKEPLKSLCYDLNNPNYSVLDPDSYNRTTLKIYKYSFLTHKYSQEIPVSEALETFKTPYLISYFGHKKLSKDTQSRDTTNDFWQKTTHICPICGEKIPLSMFQINQNIRLTVTYETKKRSKNTSENTENSESSLEKPFKKQSIFNQILSSEPLLVCEKCSQKAWKEQVEALKRAYEMTSEAVNQFKHEYESAFLSTENNSKNDSNGVKNDSNNSKNASNNTENPPKKKRGRPRKMV